jgi:hypothetical protein
VNILKRLLVLLGFLVIVIVFLIQPKDMGSLETIPANGIMGSCDHIRWVILSCKRWSDEIQVVVDFSNLSFTDTVTFTEHLGNNSKIIKLDPMENSKVELLSLYKGDEYPDLLFSFGGFMGNSFCYHVF